MDKANQQSAVNGRRFAKTRGVDQLVFSAKNRDESAKEHASFCASPCEEGRPAIVEERSRERAEPFSTLNVI